MPGKIATMASITHIELPDREAEESLPSVELTDKATPRDVSLTVILGLAELASAYMLLVNHEAEPDMVERIRRVMDQAMALPSPEQ
jgi:hypothetical protein